MELWILDWVYNCSYKWTDWIPLISSDFPAQSQSVDRKTLSKRIRNVADFFEEVIDPHLRLQIRWGIVHWNTPFLSIAWRSVAFLFICLLFFRGAWWHLALLLARWLRAWQSSIPVGCLAGHVEEMNPGSFIHFWIDFSGKDRSVIYETLREGCSSIR